MLAIAGGTVVTMEEPNRVLPGATVLVESDTILGVKQKGEPLPEGKMLQLDATGMVVLPGLINIHSCLAQSLTRGREFPDESPFGIKGAQFAKKQTREVVLYGGLAGVIEQIRSGVTTIFDYHTPSNGSRSSLATLADVFSIAGVRGCLSLATRDPCNGGDAQSAFKETENFLKWCRRERLANIKGMVGIHRSLTCSDAVLETAADLATRMGVGTHLELAADPADVQDCLSRFGMRVAQRMHDFGVVGPETVAASCVQANEDEIDILRNSETLVAHTPSTDLSRGRQTAPILTMLRRGIRVGIGTGRDATNPLAEARLSRLLHSHLITQAGEGAAGDFLKMIFTENARLAGSVFGFRLGRIAEGAVADISAFRVPLPEGLTESRWAEPILYSLAPMARAEHLVVGGNLVLRDGVLQTIEEDEILQKAREVAQSLE